MLILLYFLYHTQTRNILHFIQRQQEKSFNNADWQFATAITESSAKTESSTKNNILQPGPLAICYIGEKKKGKKPTKQEQKTKQQQKKQTTTKKETICFSSNYKPGKKKTQTQLFSLDQPLPPTAAFVFLQVHYSSF